MMKPSCKNCKYFSGEVLFGSCYRFPSQVEVEAAHWCGEFKSKTTTEKEPKPKVSKDDMDSVIRAYKNEFGVKFGSIPSVNKADYAAAKKMILEDGVEPAVNYVRAFFANMPQWNLTNRVFDLRVIPSLRNKLMLTPTVAGEQTVEQFLNACSDGERHSRLWPEYADYVKKTGKKISMKDWVKEVNG